MAAEQFITRHLDLWTAAIKRRSTAGRGSSSKVELYGIKKLRELILELAVRGLLVPQDPKDEPACELLRKIAAEKARLVKEGKIKAGKSLPPIAKEEAPFVIPSGWALARLANVINVLNGRAYKKHEMLSEGTPILRVGNLFTSNEWYFSDFELEPEKYIDDGDLIYAWSASFGPFIWQGGKVIYHYHIWKMDFFSEADVDKYYFRHYLQAISAAIKESGNGIAMIHMTKERMEKLVLPIPPLAEQHRIVAKVDELMALCDELEQQTVASLSAHQTLVEALLNALTSAADHAQFASSWQRIAEHFDTLFTTEESIDQLKQTILQLAVMGKLVPQDPNDEPASELLKKIGAKPKRHALTGWATVSLGQLGDILGGATPSKSNAEYWVGEVPWVSPKDMKRSFIVDAEDHVSESAISNSPLKKIPSGSLLMVVRGMILAHSFPVAITENEVTINQDMKALVIPREIGAYLLTYMQAMKQAFVALVDRSSHGTCKLVSEKLWSQPVWLPPHAEQLRIVAKVDELMALCDQLKSRLNAADQLRLKLAEAVTDAALNPPSGKVIPFPDVTAREARRHAIGCHAVAALKDQRSFGRTMLMKLIYLADTHVGADLAMEVERYAAGPFDQWIYRFEEHAEAASWFNHEKTQGDKIRYKPQAGLAVQAAKVHELLDATQVAELDRVLKLFTALSTEDAEIIATLFAAWNDFLIDGHMPDDAEIIREVREHWTPEKQRFSPEKLQTWLHWLRKNKLVPRGHGPRTVQQGRLFH